MAGCFNLHGLFASPRFKLTVEHPNFKPVTATHPMGWYTVDVTLASADSAEPSRMVFHERPVNSPRPTCSDKQPPPGAARLNGRAAPALLVLGW